MGWDRNYFGRNFQTGETVDLGSWSSRDSEAAMNLLPNQDWGVVQGWQETDYESFCNDETLLEAATRPNSDFFNPATNSNADW